MFFVKPISKELILKHFPNMTVERGWFGTLRFRDPASGVRGYAGRRYFDFRAKGSAIEATAYLSFARLFLEAYISPEAMKEDLREDVAEVFAMAWQLKEKWHRREIWWPVGKKAKREKRISRDRIIWHLDPLGLKKIRRRFPHGYVLTMASGRRIDVTATRFDFPRPSNMLTSFEEEAYAGQLELECMRMADSVWGGIRFSSAQGQELLDIAFAAEKCGLRLKDERILVLRHFGLEATIKKSWLGVMTINVPNRGYVKCEGRAIVKVCGDLLRPSLAMIHEKECGRVVVRGKADLLVMATREGRAMGITVTPESDLDTFITIAANCSVIVGMVIAFQWLDFWSSVFAGYVGGSFLCSLLFGVFAKPLQAMARRKGLEMVGLETSAPVRKASIEEAKKRGML